MASVLVIDENVEDLHFIQSALKGCGHEVVAVGSASRADGLLAARAFDAVILEMLMEEWDGVQMILSIKQRSPRCPVIAVSGGGTMVNAGYALRIAKAVGADETLPKPMSATDICEAVERVIAGPSGN